LLREKFFYVENATDRFLPLPNPVIAGYGLNKTMKIKIHKIQPSQLYISEIKFKKVWKNFDCKNYEPLPIKELDGEIILTDGHTRALVAYLKGIREVKVEWETEEWDWDLYRLCVKWCKKQKIRKISDLRNRIVSENEYEHLWLERCKKAGEELKKPDFKGTK